MFAEGTTSMLLFNLGAASLASFEKSNVLTLTYTVSENFTAQSHPVQAPRSAAP